MTAELSDGVPPEERVNHKRVARVMAERSITGIRLRRRVRTTIPEPSGQLLPDLLERDFTAQAPNTVYVGDITYLLCGDGRNLYLATVIDCFSRRLVGWSIADHMRTELVTDALLAAAAERGSLAGAIFPATTGPRVEPAQYSARSYAGLCDRLGVHRSMGAIGSSADNALAESFNATLNRETLVRLGDPLQHPLPALDLRPHQPDHLRERPPHLYAANRCVDTQRMSTIRGQGPSTCDRSW